MPINVSLFINTVDDKRNPDNYTVIVNEAYNDHFRIELLGSNVDDFIKKNPNIKQVSNPIYFNANNSPTPDGLFSNEIFGITKESRSGIYAYIDLHGYFLHPLVYKKLCRTDSKIKSIIHGTKRFIFSDGQFIPDENGETGIDFLRKHYKDIKLKTTESSKRDEVIDFIETTKNIAFMSKLLVMPPMYRDVHSDGNSIGVGDINKLYNSILLSVRSLEGADDFGLLSTFDSTKGRIQELILAIYDLVCANTNPMVEEQPGLSKKYGLFKMAGISKTATYGSRLVITAPELKVEAVDDIRVDIKHSALPLHSAIANFKPFVMFWVRRFFENNMLNGLLVRKQGKEVVMRVKDPAIQFGDERIEEELKRFIEGHSNRFIPIEAVMEDDSVVPLKFKGKHKSTTDTEPGDSPIINRTMTWCDVFYMAAVEATKDKHILITRYPIDSVYSQFPTKIVINSTIDTEPIIFNNQLYPYYPKIREEDIGKDTSGKFIDSLWMSNLMLDSIGGDYDGDQTSVKGIFTQEANEELDHYISSKRNYIGLDMNCIRSPGTEAYQSIYSLTRYLDNAPPLTPAKDIKFKVTKTKKK